jgi:hypothetical protein
MTNMIEMATAVNASVHEVGEHNSVIVFTEEQLNDFVNRLSPRIVVFRQVWLALSRLKRSALDYIEDTTEENKDYLEYDIGTAYDVLQEHEKLFFSKEV